MPTLGGLTLIQVALVFALANTAFSLADLIFGQLDQINRYLREGKLEAFLVRPLPLMAQLVTADFQLRRAGRMVFALLVGAVVLVQADPVLDLRTVYLLIITPFVGAAIYGALFVLAGGLQFWLVDGAEFTNAFVYGGSYAGQVPGSTLLLPIRVLFTFVIPATLVAYLPAMLILRLPGPALLPTWLGWLAPLFARLDLADLADRVARGHSPISPGPEADQENGRSDHPDDRAAPVVRRQRQIRADTPNQAGGARRRWDHRHHRGWSVLRVYRCQRGRQVDHDQDAERHLGADVGAGADLWPGPGAQPPSPGSRPRSCLWSAQPAVVGPAAAGLLPDPGRNPPARPVRGPPADRPAGRRAWAGRAAQHSGTPAVPR